MKWCQLESGAKLIMKPNWKWRQIENEHFKGGRRFRQFSFPHFLFSAKGRFLQLGFSAVLSQKVRDFKTHYHFDGKTSEIAKRTPIQILLARRFWAGFI